MGVGQGAEPRRCLGHQGVRHASWRSRCTALLLEVVGQAGYLAEGSPGAVLRGRLEQQARSQTIFTFGGGTNEIQRDIIAMIGLGMPRAPR